jgi:predicted nucleic acid-binding protein
LKAVVDASVFVKLFLDEDGSEAARRLAREEHLLAPAFLRIECANVLATAVRQGRLPEAPAILAISSISRRLRLVDEAAYLLDAHSMSVLLRRSVYDCLYLALARREGASVNTADTKFFNAVMADGTYAGFIRLL